MSSSLQLILLYILTINILGFIMMGIDKRKAQKKSWRVRERTFFVIAIIGASIGVWLGMKYLRHKTKHQSFRLGIPFIVGIQVIVFICYLLFIRD